MKKIALISIMFAGSVLCNCLTVSAQQKKAAPKAKPKPKSEVAPAVKIKPDAEGFIHLESGLQYKVVKHGTGKQHPNVGDHLEMHIHVHIKDSSLFDSRKMNNSKPVPFQVLPANFKGDPIEGFCLLVAGDSALMRLPVDSLLAQKKQMLPGMNAGDMLNYEVVLVSVATDADFKAKQAVDAAKQRVKDDKLLEDYFKKNKIKATKTESGLRYTIAKQGTGELPARGQSVSVNYTGMLLNGKKFDSNIDPEFKHPGEPLMVELGMGKVIRGWDEGLALLKKGAKATFYIPSGLAYGAQDRSPTIPANSILVFDVEITDIASQPEIDEKLIQAYCAKNNIKAQKTASGLYYSITQEGKGERPIAGQKVSVKYTGTTLDGRKFDSNMDKPDPFTFTLGQGQVIKGWDEGIALLNKGAKAVLLIPSGIAYGAQSPTQAIPPNSVLSFEVELTDIQKQ